MEKGGSSLGFKMFQVNWNMFAKDISAVTVNGGATGQDTVLCGSAISMLSKASQLRPQQLSVHPCVVPIIVSMASLSSFFFFLSIID